MDDADLPSLVRHATRWRDADPDPRTRRELDLLIEQLTAGDDLSRTEARVDLSQRFAGSLSFGTAGLRGVLGAGPNRMNRAVVIRAAAGLAGYLRHGIPDRPGERPPRVVVGYDARRDSDVFARDSCAVFSAAGCLPILLPGPLPTPVLAFALRRLDADAGVMVTASHNPPQDNGYKVYLGGRIDRSPGSGAQIVPPHDARIAARIAEAPQAIEVPMSTGGWQVLAPSIVDDYLRAICGLIDPDAPHAIDVVLTPLHGVGGETAVKAFSRAGFPVPHLVPEQALPDPAFPTVAFPNPEEPGAMDLALASARARGAHLVIANDPDADRCAVAVPDPKAPGGRGWRMLRGDEVGALLGEYLLSREPAVDGAAAVPGAAGLGAAGLGAAGQGAAGLSAPGLGAAGLGAAGLSAPGQGAPDQGDAGQGAAGLSAPDQGAPDQGAAGQGAAGQGAAARKPRTVASSIVSSQLLSRIAHSHGDRHVETLTGFKWLSRVPDLFYAYEEALGYCVAPDLVRDKDGISAALLIAQLAATLKADGRTLLDALDDLARQHGVHATDQFSIRVDDLGKITAMVQKLQHDPPERLGGGQVVSAVDLSAGVDGLPPTEGLRYRTADGVRVIVRPSGTEPKLKCYLEVVVPVGAKPGALAAARATAAERLKAIRHDVAAALGVPLP